MTPFYTSVVELEQLFEGSVATHPYECGWSREAIFFVQTSPDGPHDAHIDLRVQISPDGVRWLDEGSVVSVSADDHSFVKVSHFGGFLRLEGTVRDSRGEPTEAILTVRLALKG